MIVVVAEEASVFRYGFRVMAEKHSDIIEAVYEAATQEEAISLIQAHQPDLVVSGLGHDGVGVAHSLVKAAKNTMHCLIVMEDPTLEEKAAALKGGIFVIDRAAPPEALWSMVESIGQSNVVPIDLDIIEMMALQTHLPPQVHPLDDLSPLQRKALALAAHGLTDADIGKRLGKRPVIVKEARELGFRRVEERAGCRIDLGEFYQYLRELNAFQNRAWSGRFSK